MDAELALSLGLGRIFCQRLSRALAEGLEDRLGYYGRPGPEYAFPQADLGRETLAVARQIAAVLESGQRCPQELYQRHEELVRQCRAASEELFREAAFYSRKCHNTMNLPMAEIARQRAGVLAEVASACKYGLL